MKKRLLALFMCMTMVLAATGCGSENKNSVDNTETESTENTESGMPTPDLAKYTFTYSDYVTLGEYTGIPVELSDSYEVADGAEVEYLEQLISTYGPFYTEDADKTVIEEGDIVNVNYVGKLDGVAFDGGSAENQLIDVSGNCSVSGSPYIDGFTTGLLGAEVGSEVDCDVTFPAEYHNADLAGKPVVFTFTVNSIQRELTLDDVDDTFAQEQFNVETVEEMYAMIKEGLTSNALYYKNLETEYVMRQHLFEICEVEIPADYFADLFDAYCDVIVYEQLDGDETQLEEFFSMYYGYTIDEMQQNFRESVQYEFILSAIAEKEGIGFDEAFFEEYVENAVAEGGYGNRETLYEIVGYGDAAYGEMYMENSSIWTKVLEKLEETAVITVAEPAE